MLRQLIYLVLWSNQICFFVQKKFWLTADLFWLDDQSQGQLLKSFEKEQKMDKKANFNQIQKLIEDNLFLEWWFANSIVCLKFILFKMIFKTQNLTRGKERRPRCDQTCLMGLLSINLNGGLQLGLSSVRDQVLKTT